MKQTSLCYIENAGHYLMMHRTKKKNDENSGKWIGIGGKFLPGESPEECMLREVMEEAGITPQSYSYRGIVTFESDVYETENMHLFTAKAASRFHAECDEGELAWIAKTDISSLNLWEGDRIFLELITDESAPFFNLRLVYEGDALVSACLNDKEYLI